MSVATDFGDGRKPGIDKPDIVRALFAAYYNKDRAALDALLTADFRFTSPYDDAIDKATYFERCWPASQHMTGHTLEKIVDLGGDEVMVQYECKMPDGEAFQNVEVMAFAGSRVRSVNVYFGAMYKNGKFAKWDSATSS